MKLDNIELGMKVVPISKYGKIGGTLDSCGQWNKAKRSRRYYLYVTDILYDQKRKDFNDPLTIIKCSYDIKNMKYGNEYLLYDLIPYYRITGMMFYRAFKNPYIGK